MIAMLKQPIKYEVFYFDGTEESASIITERFNKSKENIDDNTSVLMFSAYPIENVFEIEPYLTNDCRVIYSPIVKDTYVLFLRHKVLYGYIEVSPKEFAEKYMIVEE